MCVQEDPGYTKTTTHEKVLFEKERDRKIEVYHNRQTIARVACNRRGNGHKYEAGVGCIPAAIERSNPSRNCVSVRQRESVIEKAKLWMRVQVLLWSVSVCGKPKEIERKGARGTKPQHFPCFPLFCLTMLHLYKGQGLRAIYAPFRSIQLYLLLSFALDSQNFYLILMQHKHKHTHSTHF